MSYPLDYGHLTGTIAGDGGVVDVFIGSECGRSLMVVVLIVELRKRDVETKILLDCTDHDMQLARQFCADILKIGGYLIPRRR